MQFNLWYTGKCIVLASLKAGSQYMRWARGQAENNREWYGTTVQLIPDLSNIEFKIFKNKRYGEIIKEFKDSISEIDFVNQSLFREEDIPILIFTRDPLLRFGSGIAQALGAGYASFILADYKKVDLKSYLYLTSIIKRKKILDPFRFRHDYVFRSDFNGVAFNVSNENMFEMFYSNNKFKEHYKKLIKFYLITQSTSILLDSHCTLRNDSNIRRLINTRLKNGISNKNITYIELDNNKTTTERNLILSKYGITPPVNTKVQHTQGHFRDIILECIKELPEENKSIYYERLDQYVDDSEKLWKDIRTPGLYNSAI